MQLSEHDEAVILADWLRFNKYKFHHSPNETFTKSWTQKRKNKEEWVSKWFPDYCIILKRWSLLFIELKKSKWKRWWMNWSQISPEQKEWIDELEKLENTTAHICFWAEESIKLIKDYEKVLDIYK